MLNFVWKYKFILYVLIFIFFINSLISILNPKIFFETERILKYADDIQIELKESFNDKNLVRGVVLIISPSRLNAIPST